MNQTPAHASTAAAAAVPAEATRAPERESRAARVWRTFVKKVVPPGIALVIGVAIWQYVVKSGMVDEILLPAPSDIASSLWSLLSEDFFWKATRITATETVLGFLIGSAFGLVLGALIASLPLFRTVVYPHVLTFNNLPRVAFAPLFLTWFGFGMSSKIVMAAAICFFPVLIGVVVGIDTVDKDARMLMRSFGATRWQTFKSLTLPSSLPLVFAGFVSAMSFALIGAIVAEFVGATEGLGVLITQFNFQLNVADSFALILVLALMGLVFYGAMELLYRKVVYWEHR
jgi:NitT/TauT family transport system permease protein